MNVIKHRFRLLFIISSLILLVTLASLFYDIALVTFTAVLITIILLGCTMCEYSKLKTAQLILESKIMYIKTMQIEDKDKLIEDVEVYISCFGILLGSRIIKFNIDRIKLKGVEISSELICLYYGTDNTMQKVSILHGYIEKNELRKFVDKFRYETGVTPIIRDL